MRKKTLLLMLLASLLINLVLYCVTMHRTDSISDGINFRSSIERPFYADYGPALGPYPYAAGIPFQSNVAYDDNGDGCPCAGVSKVHLTMLMVPSIEFLLNFMFWLIPSVGYIWLRKRRAYTRH